MNDGQGLRVPGELARWVDFDKSEFNLTAMKDHMFYHSGMLRGL